jgi:hypothetical protein
VKTISSALAQHLAGEVTTLATCWQITRRDGIVLGFTDHVRDFEVDGITYKAASGYTRTAIRGTDRRASSLTNGPLRLDPGGYAASRAPGGWLRTAGSNAEGRWLAAPL